MRKRKTREELTATAEIEAFWKGQFQIYAADFKHWNKLLADGLPVASNKNFLMTGATESGTGLLVTGGGAMEAVIELIDPETGSVPASRGQGPDWEAKQRRTTDPLEYLHHMGLGGTIYEYVDVFCTVGCSKCGTVQTKLFKLEPNTDTRKVVYQCCRHGYTRSDKCRRLTGSWKKKYRTPKAPVRKTPEEQRTADYFNEIWKSEHPVADNRCQHEQSGRFKKVTPGESCPYCKETL